MQDPFGLFNETISISYARLLLEICEKYDISTVTLLENTGLTLLDIKQHDAKMSAHQWSKLVANALQLTGNYRLGIEYGYALRPTAHGSLGFAFLSCVDVETALNLCQHFFCTRIQSFIPNWTFNEKLVYIYLDDVHPVKLGDEQQSQQLRTFLIESLLFGGIHLLELLIQENLENCEIFLDWCESSDYEEVLNKNTKIHFNSKRNAIAFPLKYLKHSNPQGDLVAFQQAIQYCEKDKSLIVKDATYHLQNSIRMELLHNFNKNYPSLPEIAKRLNMSERTIKRHLQTQGTSFLQILNEIRFKEAKKLLAKEQYKIQDIATLIGYEESTNFVRAFKKQFGLTPHQYRKINFQK
ncbi:AraC family transcriptional regulator [Acinetobacter calcoaceticus]|uniref:AraC-like DNA-binding protein n=1 Tax=Acinetobacter calcoaceticus TaxID=471 RepID=A0ABD5AIU7_ACICA|nr:AraC family transcriptional regulator [Acinetobacter calcoaceticus]MDP9802268.1 AraC-like DNA-binding protein [Acinetobacter calcoaceticus]